MVVLLCFFPLRLNSLYVQWSHVEIVLSLHRRCCYGALLILIRIKQVRGVFEWLVIHPHLCSWRIQVHLKRQTELLGQLHPVVNVFSVRIYLLWRRKFVVFEVNGMVIALNVLCIYQTHVLRIDILLQLGRVHINRVRLVCLVVSLPVYHRSHLRLLSLKLQTLSQHLLQNFLLVLFVLQHDLLFFDVFEAPLVKIVLFEIGLGVEKA